MKKETDNTERKIKDLKSLLKMENIHGNKNTMKHLSMLKMSLLVKTK